MVVLCHWQLYYSRDYMKIQLERGVLTSIHIYFQRLKSC